MKNNLFTRTKTYCRTANYVGTIQNTPAKMSKFREFRKVLRQTAGKLVMLHGRNPNRKALAAKLGVTHDRIRQDVPHKWATSFDVYWRS